MHREAQLQGYFSEDRNGFIIQTNVSCLCLRRTSVVHVTQQLFHHHTAGALSGNSHLNRRRGPAHSLSLSHLKSSTSTMSVALMSSLLHTLPLQAKEMYSFLCLALVWQVLICEKPFQSRVAKLHEGSSVARE